MWIMLRIKLPTEISPPKMSLFWSTPWPGPWDDSMLNKIKRNINPNEEKDRRVSGRMRQKKKDIVPLTEEELGQEFFFDLVGFGLVHNWARARKIHYKDSDIRIFPNEFSVIDNEKMQFYLNEGAYELMAGSVAENQLIFGPEGHIIEDHPSFLSEYPQSEQRLIYEAALIDGCNHAQALILAFGGDPTDELSAIPPIGWYRLKQEYASVFCHEWEMKE